VLELGGNPLLSPPVNVTLPLEVRANTFKNVGWGIVAIMLGIPLVPLSALVCVTPIIVLVDSLWSLQNAVVTVVLLVLGPLMLVLTVQSFLSGFVALSDARRRGPALTIDVGGLTDHRCGVRIAWGHIACIQPINSNSGVVGLLLLLRTPITGRASRFRVGTAGISFHRVRQPHYRLALAFLEPGAWVLMSVIGHRAHASGAEIDWRVPWI
jgi:hypothetical protein